VRRGGTIGLAALFAGLAVLVLAPGAAAQTPDSFTVQSAVSGNRVTVTARNTGTRPLHWVGVFFHFQADATAVSSAGASNCEVNADAAACLFTNQAGQPNFLPGQARTIVVDTSVPLSVGTQISICGGGTLTDQVCVPSNVATGAPDLALAFEGPSAIQVGDRTRYTFVVTNVGTARSAGREIRITTAKQTAPDRETQFGGNPWAPEGEATSTSVTVPALDPGESRRFSINTWTEALFSPLGTLLLTSWGSSGERTLVAEITGDPTPGANRAEHRTTLTVGPPPRNDSNANRPRGTTGPRSRRAPAALAPRIRALTGTASGNVTRVTVALARLTRARSGSIQCSWLTSRSVRFARGRGTHGGCRRPEFIDARGARRWRLALNRRLPNGCYLLFSSAVSAAGRPERRFSARDRNYVGFCVR
jgi:hypothetical protein